MKPKTSKIPTKSSSPAAKTKQSPTKGAAQVGLSPAKKLTATTSHALDSDELDKQSPREDQEDRDDDESSTPSAEPSGPTEVSASFKNFRHQPDMENFYRFIFENDLRHEALAIIDEVMRERASKLAHAPSTSEA